MLTDFNNIAYKYICYGILFCLNSFVASTLSMLYKLVSFCLIVSLSMANDSSYIKCASVLKDSIISKGKWALYQQPITTTASYCDRSAGDRHDFYSEGDYWWPDPNNPNGSYIQKDGMSNPNNFVDHRKALIRFSQIIGSLASAYSITHKDVYIKQAIIHLKAWFIDTATFMNPSLLYAQAIKGKVTGRGTGIIDMIQMMEVVKGIEAMEKSKAMDANVLNGVKQWFANYLNWVTTHSYGMEERDAKNNHGTCWVMQVAVFAKFTNNQTLINYCKNRFKTFLLPNQLEKGGSFPLEMSRTKPYGYSLFNLDAMTTICQELSTKNDNLWNFSLPDGRNIKQAVEFMLPFVANKSLWKLKPDVMYWDEWPVAQPFLIFGYQAYGNNNLLQTWVKLNHYPKVEEVIRNLPVRNPLLWLN